MSEKDSEKKEIIEEENPNLFFTNARVVKILRKHNKGKRINSRVKVELNRLLEDIGKTISLKLSQMPYSTITYADFKQAAKEYYELKKIHQERKRVVRTLDKLREDIEFLAEDLNERLERDNDESEPYEEH